MHLFQRSAPTCIGIRHLAPPRPTSGSFGSSRAALIFPHQTVASAPSLVFATTDDCPFRSYAHAATSWTSTYGPFRSPSSPHPLSYDILFSRLRIRSPPRSVLTHGFRTVAWYLFHLLLPYDLFLGADCLITLLYHLSHLEQYFLSPTLPMNTL